MIRISSSDLDTLVSNLDLQFVTLSGYFSGTEYLPEPGNAFSPGIYYCLAGRGLLFPGEDFPLELLPHTLIIVPPGSPIRIEAAGSLLGVKWIGGYFQASYGSSIDLFGSLSSPIAEQFSDGDGIDEQLKTALREFGHWQPGSGAMTAALLRQVIVAVLRRSLSSVNLWVERFSVLKDPEIARAFSSMITRPGSAHSIESLAHSALLSRSAFMARFAALFGKTPMAVLRDLRIRQAARQLTMDTLCIDQIARGAGYHNRSSFVKAFRQVYQCDPSDYRTAIRRNYICQNQ